MQSFNNAPEQHLGYLLGPNIRRSNDAPAATTWQRELKVLFSNTGYLPHRRWLRCVHSADTGHSDLAIGHGGCLARFNLPLSAAPILAIRPIAVIRGRLYRFLNFFATQGKRFRRK